MLIDKWFPFYDIEKTLDEMDRIFGIGGRPVELRSVPRGTFPTINIYDRGQHLFLTAEIPGIDPKQLELSIANNTLTLRGSRAVDEPGNVKFYRRERLSGSFERTITLPVHVDSTNVKAGYRNGVLEVEMPKAEKAKARTIKVSGE